MCTHITWNISVTPKTSLPCQSLPTAGSRQPLTCFLSTKANLPILESLRWNYIVYCVQFLSLGLKPAWLISVVACPFLFIVEYYSIVWTYHHFSFTRWLTFVISSFGYYDESYKPCFTSRCKHVFISLGQIYLGVEVLSSMVSKCLTL